MRVGAARSKEAYDQSLDLGQKILLYCQGMVSAGGIKKMIAGRLVDSGTAIGICLSEARMAADDSSARSKQIKAKEHLAASLYWLQTQITKDEAPEE